MDRKEFFSDLLKPRKGNPIKASGLAANTFKNPTSETVFGGSLSPFKGKWGEREVTHLLRRLTFGAPKDEVEFFKTLSLNDAVDLLLNTKNDNIGIPLKLYKNRANTPSNDLDWQVPFGETWLNLQSYWFNVNKDRTYSLKSWWLGLMINQPRSIEEKMIVFWSTHFAVEFSRIRNAISCYDYLSLLRRFALGDFKEFTKQITLNPAMLKYLNGYVNRRQAPDENYARELQELFTVGKGPASGYNENDVKAAARCLTGWDFEDDRVTTFYSEVRHDTSDKQFSAFYNNEVIIGQQGPDGGEAELDMLLNMIFKQDEVALYMCRRFYRFFVYGNISDEVESSIITPLAATFRNSGFQVKPVLEQLFKSEHFFDSLIHGAMIKSPLDVIVGAIREFKIKLPQDTKSFDFGQHIGYFLDQSINQYQNIGDVPNVSGWPAYYQHPLYDKMWFNSNAWGHKEKFAVTILDGFKTKTNTTVVDIIQFAKIFSDPGNPDRLVREMCQFLLSNPLLPETINRIKIEFLLTGQNNDAYWTNAWNAFLASPTDMIAFNSVFMRLHNLLGYILNMEEYHLV